MTKKDDAVPIESLERLIYEIRGQKVMLDRDLAALYGVETKALKRAVNRNRVRFPSDFMFQLTAAEYDSLRGCSEIRFVDFRIIEKKRDLPVT